MFRKIIVQSILTMLAISMTGISPIYADTTSPGVILSTHARCMMGHIVDKKWIPSDERIKLPADFTSPESYDLYVLNKNKLKIKATTLTLKGYPCEDRYYVNFAPEIKNAYTALGNVPWNPLPTPVKSINPNSKAYRKVIADLLKEKGLNKPKVRILQILITDIQGDGKDEVFITATYFADNKNGPTREVVPAFALKGDYSLVAFREVIDEKPVTRLVVGEIHLKDSFRPEPPAIAPNEYYINSILDINGDGIMDVVVDDTVMEGLGAGVYVLENNKFVNKLYCGCGF